MKLFRIFNEKLPESDSLPSFIRSAEDVHGIRVLRLQGAIDKSVGAEVTQSYEQVAVQGVFQRPLLLDFADALKPDFSTVAYMVQSLRIRMSSGARVGIINPGSELLAELEIARIKPLFTIFESEDRAIAELRTDR